MMRSTPASSAALAVSISFCQFAGAWAEKLSGWIVSCGSGIVMAATLHIAARRDAEDIAARRDAEDIAARRDAEDIAARRDEEGTVWAPTEFP